MSLNHTFTKWHDRECPSGLLIHARADTTIATTKVGTNHQLEEQQESCDLGN